MCGLTLQTAYFTSITAPFDFARCSLHEGALLLGELACLLVRMLALKGTGRWKELICSWHQTPSVIDTFTPASHFMWNVLFDMLRVQKHFWVLGSSVAPNWPLGPKLTSVMRQAQARTSHGLMFICGEEWEEGQMGMAGRQMFGKLNAFHFSFLYVTTNHKAIVYLGFLKRRVENTILFR